MLLAPAISISISCPEEPEEPIWLVDTVLVDPADVILISVPLLPTSRCTVVIVLLLLPVTISKSNTPTPVCVEVTWLLAPTVVISMSELLEPSVNVI